MIQLFKISIRQIFSKSQIKHTKFIVFFNIISITISFTGFFVILSLSNGFNNELRSALAASNGHYRINSYYQSPSFFSEIKESLSEHSSFLAYSEYNENYAIIKKNGLVEGVRLVGVEEGKAKDIFNVSFGKANKNVNRPDIIIGRGMAKQMEVGIGDSLLVLSRSTDSSKSYHFNASWLWVSSIFDTGFDYYDSHSCFLKIQDSKEIFGYGTEYGITGVVKNPEEIRLQNNFFSDLNIEFANIITWVDWSRNSLEWLDSYKAPIMFICLLISIIALSNMSLSLWVLAQDKIKEISVLLTIGFTRRMISLMFLIQSFVLTTIGLSLSIILSAIILFIQDKYKVITISKEVYHIDYLPVSINFNQMFYYSIIFIFLSLSINFLPACKLYFINSLEYLSDE